jgi:hypothetical protein
MRAGIEQRMEAIERKADTLYDLYDVLEVKIAQPNQPFRDLRWFKLEELFTFKCIVNIETF